MGKKRVDADQLWTLVQSLPKAERERFWDKCREVFMPFWERYRQNVIKSQEEFEKAHANSEIAREKLLVAYQDDLKSTKDAYKSLGKLFLTLLNLTSQILDRTKQRE